MDFPLGSMDIDRNDRVARNTVDKICEMLPQVCSSNRVNTALHANEIARIACTRRIVSRCNLLF